MTDDKIKKFPLEQLFAELKTSSDGLTDAEAHNRVGQYGQNTFHTESRRTTIGLLLKQFKSSLVYLLIAACIISFLLQDWNDGIVIAVILTINAGLGFYQEYKSGKAIEKLQKLVGRDILVRRGGRELLVPEKYLTLGDLVVLREGDIVPADVRLIHAEDFSVNESQLTGESAAVKKTILGNESLVFAGSTIEQGEARGLVYAVGENTQLGKIAHLSTGTRRVTQYEQSLASFSSFLLKLTLITLALVFICKLLIVHDVSQISALALFMVALSVAVVPEAMPVIATVTLSRGALMLAKKHVVAKTLTAVEDLGNITVLCSDKTGTLTENKQTVKHLVAKDEHLFQVLAMASLETVDEKRKRFQGSFDQAFLRYIPAAIQKEAGVFKRLEELPFDPAARRRRVVATNGTKTYLIEVGALETLLKLTGDAHADRYTKMAREDGNLGFRHLAIAYKEISYDGKDEFDILKHEKGLHFVGFVALEDPLRPSAKHTIELAKSLGVGIKILSGDSPEVTRYVASEVGLVHDKQVVYTGDELEKLSDLEVSRIVRENNAFARLNPEQKYRLIKLLKLSGEVVGYQGDGINDAPALKLADVAIAVKGATEVARDSADILLLRDNLNVIVSGISYGRGIFANINKYIRYTMIGNFGNFFALSALYLLSTDLPLLTTQLLLTNLLGDVPLVAISTDNVDRESIARPSKYDMRSLISVSAVLGSYTAIFELLFFALIKNSSIGITQTSLFVFLTLLGFVVIFSVRNEEHFWKAPVLSKPLSIAFGVIALITLTVVYLAPTQSLFSFVPISPSLLALIFAMVSIYLIFLDIIKVWFYRSRPQARL